MTTEQLIIDGIKIVCAYLLGVFTEGRLMAKHYKKLLIQKDETIAMKDGYIHQLYKTMNILLQEQRESRAEVLGEHITEPDEISDEEYTQQQLYMQGLDKKDYRDAGYEQWLQEHPEMGDEHYPQVPGEVKKWQDEYNAKYSASTGHEDINNTKTD